MNIEDLQTLKERAKLLEIELSELEELYFQIDGLKG